MKNSLIDPLPMGSRWELFLDLENLEDYIDDVIKNPVYTTKNHEFGTIIGKLNEDIYSCLIFKNAKLTSAFPFFFTSLCEVPVNIKRIEYSLYGEAFAEVDTGFNILNVSCIDYSFNKKKYKKNMNLFFSAISYTFSKINLKTSKAKSLIKQTGFLKDEYTLTGEIINSKDNVFNVNAKDSSIASLPVYAKEIYLERPEKGDTGIGDIWLSAYSKDFIFNLHSEK